MTPTLIATLVSLLLGFLMKRFNIVPAKLIPIINFILQVLGQLVIPQAEAGIFSGAFAHTLGSIVAQAAMVTLLATGSHSTLKNTLEHFRNIALEAAKAKAAAKLQKDMEEGKL
jgi:hypothetical protein